MAEKARDAKKFLKTLRQEEKEMVGKFNRFVDAWKAHVHEEIAIHKKMLGGKQSLKKHIAETVRVHKKFIQKISRL